MSQSMIKQTTLWVLALLLLLGSHSAAARWYYIELIVFEQSAPNSEIFEQIVSEIKWPRKLTELTNTRHSKAALAQLPLANARLRSQDFVLHGSNRKLLNSPNYTPVLHVAWLQSVKENKKGGPIHIIKNPGVSGYNPIDGYVRLERGDLLHLKVDLEYKKGPNYYRLNERRRIRLNEIHYLDHPKFGVIVTVKPFAIKN